MNKEEFIADYSSWDDHRPLLWLALEETRYSQFPVIELGAGGGSTPYLRQYCSDNSRQFISYDYNREWADSMGSNLITNWSTADIYKRCSVLLVDHSPGEHRHEAIAIMKDLADIIVIHDTESDAVGYMYDKIWRLFRYRINFMVGTVGASAVSNSIDLSKFVGEQFGNHKVTL
jgi:hypothetical protein